MTHFYLADGEILKVEIEDAEDFKARLPEIYDALIECTAFVNQRYIEDGKMPLVALVLV